MRLLLVAILIFFLGGAKIGGELTPRKVSVPVEDLIPDYAEELERLSIVWEGRVWTSHREIMWQVVEESFQELEVDDRIKLIKFVRNYPLYAKLPADVTWNHITNVWSLCAKRFIKRIKSLPR